MKVILIRHGGIEGEERTGHLSLMGRQRIRAMARRLRQEEISPAAIVTSALPACVQSAELLAEGLEYIGLVKVLSSLSLSAPAPLAAAQVVNAADGDLVVVAQEPMLASLGAVLSSRPAFPPSREAQASLLIAGQPQWLIKPDTGEMERLLLALSR